MLTLQLKNPYLSYLSFSTSGTPLAACKKKDASGGNPRGERERKKIRKK
jgi:hypothetical protein